MNHGIGLVWQRRSLCMNDIQGFFTVLCTSALSVRTDLRQWKMMQNEYMRRQVQTRTYIKKHPCFFMFHHITLPRTLGRLGRLHENLSGCKHLFTLPHFITLQLITVWGFSHIITDHKPAWHCLKRGPRSAPCRAIPSPAPCVTWQPQVTAKPVITPARDAAQSRRCDRHCNELPPRALWEGTWQPTLNTRNAN